MSYLLQLYPGDHATWIFASVIVQVTILTTFAILLTRFPVRRSAATRSAICLCTLACALLVPLMAYSLDAAGISFVRLPLFAMATPEAKSTVTETAITENMLHEIVEPDEYAATPPAPDSLNDPSKVPSADILRQPAETSSQTIGPSPSYSNADRWHAVASGLLLIWIIGMAVCVVRLLRGCLVLKRLRTEVRLIEDHAFSNVLKEVCAALDMKRLPRVVTSRRLAGPVVTDGPGGPMVILPEGMLCDLDDRQLRDVLTHECAHLVQRDILVGMLQRTAQIIFWPHLLVHRLNGELTNAREDLCDNFVLRRGDATSYARTLVEISQALPETHVPIGACGMFDSAAHLETRIVNLLNEGRNLMTRTKRSTLVALSVVFLAVSALMSGSTLLKADAEGSVTTFSKLTGVITRSTLSGRVLGPDGKSIVGATVSVTRRLLAKRGGVSPREIIATTQCRKDGSFSIVYPEGYSLPGDSLIVAMAPGYGPDWLKVDDLKPGNKVVLQLVKDDVPINGRVLDPQGIPVAGVTVTAKNIATGSFEDHLQLVRRSAELSGPKKDYGPMAALRASVASEQSLRPASKSKSLHMDITNTTTDADGRFHLASLGRERRVSLSFRGPTIETKAGVEVVTRAMKTVALGAEYGRSAGKIYYGATLEVVVRPTRPFSGVVTDAASKQPVSRVLVQDLNGKTLTVTDEKGRYQLTGLNATSGGLRFVPNNGLPYFVANAGAPMRFSPQSPVTSGDSENGPITRNIELKKGIWITGRVVDKQTGKPVPSYVSYYPLLSNELGKKFYGTSRSYIPDSTFQTAADGTFRIPGIPGRGVVTARALQEHRYRYGVGADLAQSDGKMTVYEMGSPLYVNSIVEVDADPDAKEVSCKLELVPALRLLVRVVDPDNKPLTGVRVVGRRPYSMSISSALREPPLAGDSFEVFSLDTDEPRTVILRHAERNLGKVIELKAVDIGPDGSVTVPLQVCGTISGRLLDPQGTPIHNVHVSSSTAITSPGGRFSDTRSRRYGIPTRSMARTSTDKNGRFEFTNVPPGAKFPISFGPETAITKVVRPGEKVDLGDLTVKTPSRKQ